MYRSILVPVDLAQPHSWEKSLPTAVALSKCFDSALALCTVLPDPSLYLGAQWSPIEYRERIDVAHARLGSLAESIDHPRIAHHVEAGGIYASIIVIAHRCEADLIILSSHRPEMKDYLLGANAARVVRHAPCSVFVVRD